jgi:hypothetical protein
MRPDPRDLEAALAARACPEPPADLRYRLLAAVSAERAAPPRCWRRAWQAAVAVILALNLTMGAINGVRYQALLSRTPPPREATPTPPTGSDDYVPSFAAGAVGQLAAAPDAGRLVRRFIEQ